MESSVQRPAACLGALSPLRSCATKSKGKVKKLKKKKKVWLPLPFVQRCQLSYLRHRWCLDNSSKPRDDNKTSLCLEAVASVGGVTLTTVPGDLLELRPPETKKSCWGFGSSDKTVQLQAVCQPVTPPLRHYPTERYIPAYLTGWWLAKIVHNSAHEHVILIGGRLLISGRTRIHTRVGQRRAACPMRTRVRVAFHFTLVKLWR